jgi:hypothetical protein
MKMAYHENVYAYTVMYVFAFVCDVEVLHI